MAASVTPDPDLSCPAAENDTGAYRLSWQGPEDSHYRLTETAGDQSLVVYAGSDLGTTVTGRPEGTYIYRLEVLAPDGTAADLASCTVTVVPPSPALAFGLFGLGLAICVATIALIGRGHWRHRRGELG